MPEKPSRKPPYKGTEILVETFSPEELLGPLNELEQLYAPSKLFVAGHHGWLKDRPRVSIVGSRRASEDGLKRAAKLSRILRDHNVIVVSGLAEGIDFAAHTATVQAGGRTIAVIGTPLSDSYPRKHREFQQTLMREHLVVSQFPEGQPTTRRNFPIRNRTMALLSDASVIVEAGEGSGSLSQGWEALRLGRPVFLMASVVSQPGLEWPQTILNYGAMVLSDPSELLDRIPAKVDDALSAIA